MVSAVRTLYLSNVATALAKAVGLAISVLWEIAVAVAADLNTPL